MKGRAVGRQGITNMDSRLDARPRFMEQLLPQAHTPVAFGTAKKRLKAPGDRHGGGICRSMPLEDSPTLGRSRRLIGHAWVLKDVGGLGRVKMAVNIRRPAGTVTVFLSALTWCPRSARAVSDASLAAINSTGTVIERMYRVGKWM